MIMVLQSDAEQHAKASAFLKGKGYDTGFNNLPTNPSMIEEISKEEYLNLFTTHVWDYQDFKQIRWDEGWGWGNLAGATCTKLHIKLGFNNTFVGIMCAHVYNDQAHNHEFRCYKFGDWRTFSYKFNNQFRGDNS